MVEANTLLDITTIVDLKSANIRVKQLENLLEMYIEEKNKAFNKMQPKSVNLNCELVDGGIREDKYINYLIKVDQLTNIITEINEVIFLLRKYIEKELTILGEYEPLERKIMELRDKENKKWKDIAEATYFSERHCQRIYDKYSKRKIIEDVAKMSSYPC